MIEDMDYQSGHAIECSRLSVAMREIEEVVAAD